MKKLMIIFAASVMIVAASCGGNAGKKTSVDTRSEAVTVPDGETVVGEWDMAEIVCGDSVKVVPAELLPDADITMIFRADDTFYASTECNQISGEFASRGGTIKFGDAMMTEMACDHMEVEDALRILLPVMEYCEFSEGGSEVMIKSADGKSYMKLVRVETTPEAAL